MKILITCSEVVPHSGIEQSDTAGQAAHAYLMKHDPAYRKQHIEEEKEYKEHGNITETKASISNWTKLQNERHKRQSDKRRK